MAASAAQIDQLLPQTQCTRCGYQGCRPYAEAIGAEQADINQCPPGGAATIAALAVLTGRPVIPLNPANGIAGRELTAVIDETRCIGCAKCLPPCPVDAIVGARRQMHTVLLERCTGCELCIAPCPVDCISMVERLSLAHAPAAPTPAANRRHYEAHQRRSATRAEARSALLAARKQLASA